MLFLVVVEVMTFNTYACAHSSILWAHFSLLKANESNDGEQVINKFQYMLQTKPGEFTYSQTVFTLTLFMRLFNC
jgi:hypothetical protein